jgi:hypothetical protein
MKQMGKGKMPTLPGQPQVQNGPARKSKSKRKKKKSRSRR